MPRHGKIIWKYFEKETVQGVKIVRCTFCKQFSCKKDGIKCFNHILRCKRCPPRNRQKQIDAYYPTPKQSIATPTQSRDSTICHTTNKILPVASQNDAQKLNYHKEKRKIDCMLAIAVIKSGMSLDMLQSDAWKLALSALKPNYEVPTPKELSSSVIDTLFDYYNEEMHKDISESSSLILITSEFKNKHNCRAIDFIITTAKPVLYKSIHSQFENIAEDYLFKEVSTVLNEINGDKIFALVTENTSNVQSMFIKLIKQKYPSMLIVSCSKYIMNVLTDDIISNVDEYKNCIREISNVIDYIKRNPVEFAHFQKVQEDKYGINKKDLKFSNNKLCDETLAMLETFSSNREALKATVSVTELNFSEYVHSVVLDEKTWLIISEIINNLTLVTCDFKILEKYIATLSDVPMVLYRIKEEIKKRMVNNEIKIRRIDQLKFNYQAPPICSAANILDPKYKGKVLDFADFSSGLTFLYEYSSSRNLNREDVMLNVAQYSNKTGFFGQAAIWDEQMLQKIEPKVWWKTYCECQVISKIAIDILSIPPATLSGSEIPLDTEYPIQWRDFFTSEKELKIRSLFYKKILPDHLNKTTDKVMSITGSEIDTGLIENNIEIPQNLSNALAKLSDRSYENEF